MTNESDTEEAAPDNFPPDDRAAVGDESKTCPMCAETVKAEARMCRFCGHRFDGATGRPAAASALADGGLATRNAFLAWALASAFFMMIGSFGPWIGALGSSVSGLDGANDGWIVVGAAVVGGLCLYATRKYRGGGLWALIGGLAGSAVTIYDRAHATHLIQQQSVLFQDVVHIGWGLNVAMVASISFMICGLIWLFAVRNAPGLGEAATG